MENIKDLTAESIKRSKSLPTPRNHSLPGLVPERQKIADITKFYPTEKELVNNMNHTSLEKRYVHIRTVSDAYQTEYIKLNEMRVLYGDDAPIHLIESWLIQLCVFLDLPLYDNQVRELAFLIYDDMHFLNIAEMALLFTRIKKGHYGQFFGKINPSEFMRWCREYRTERGLFISKL